MCRANNYQEVLVIDRSRLTFKPLSAQTWDDFERLFREHGIQDGCWCMYWRARREDCQRQYGEGNRKAFKSLVDAGKVTGLLAYLDYLPIAWCSISPRAEVPVVERSPTLKPVDAEAVWSIVCFFVSKLYRRQGMTQILIEQALVFARQHGAKIVEAYPLRTQISKMLQYERFMGIQSTFERLGFKVVIQRSERRPVMRYYLG